MKYNNILQTIGNTPMIRLNNINENKKVNIYAKLEGQNPGGSVKDRVALYMIEKAEREEKLNKNKTIIEATSGNMGIALAMVGAYKGYKVKIIMSEGMSKERRMILETLGAELILTDKKFGTEGAIKKAKELVKKSPDKYWFANQFNNENNVSAHYNGIAKEILNEVRHIDYLVLGTGTSGTLMGIAKRFKKDSPQTKIIAVIPPSGYQIQGIQNPKKDFIGKIFDSNLEITKDNVSVKDAFDTVKKVAKKEGLFLGMSSGAALFSALKIKSGNIVVILPDRGEKYLSTNLFN